MEKIKVLFVCLGNICRSPAAEGSFRKLIQEKNLGSHVSVDSCGTAGYHIGELPDPRTRKTAAKRGINLTHKARKFTAPKDFQDFDYILCMDKSNYSQVQQLTPEEDYLKKVFLFRIFDSERGFEEIVPDPYYGSIEDFEEVQNIVERASLGFLNFLIQEGKLKS